MKTVRMITDSADKQIKMIRCTMYNNAQKRSMNTVAYSFRYPSKLISKFWNMITHSRLLSCHGQFQNSLGINLFNFCIKFETHPRPLKKEKHSKLESVNLDLD